MVLGMKWYLLVLVCLPRVLGAEPLSMPSGDGLEVDSSLGLLNNLSQVKEISCKDILLDNQSFTDPDANLVFQHVYTLCTMEVSMQKYIEYRKNLKQNDDELTIRAKKELARLQKLLPTFLNAFRITVDMFDNKDLRENLNEKINDYRQINTFEGVNY